MTDASTFADIFEAAADVVATSWHQGDYYKLYTDGPHYCAIGALGVVCRNDVDIFWVPREDDSHGLVYRAADIAAHHLAAHHLVTRISSVYIDDVNGIDIMVNWNDDEETTQDQVADTFRHIAKDLRNGATP
jgi:hypothetical protein